MDSQEQQHAQTASVSNPYLLRLKCFLCKALNPNVNDENNNLKKTNSNTNENFFNPISKLPLYTCPDCEAKIRLEEKEISNSSTITSQNHGEPSERMIIVPATSSDDDEDDEDNDDDSDCWCPACVSLIDDEHDSKYRELWEHLAHIVKCLYRTTDKDFSENQLSSDISKAKQYVKKLTKLNPQSLFNKLESLVLDYVREIRKQVLERFHTCSKTSHDVQLFISFLLDEYQMFIQAANNVSSIVSYLEEHYMKSFHLTWLLYNKHLYEELIYMDRKIHHSMTTMIDLLQPVNDDASENHRTDYSPAEYTQLLNRFLAFDEEMSEIACLYKDSQAKLISKTLGLPRHNGSPAGLKTEKKRCKKLKNSLQLTNTAEETINSSTSTAVDIPMSTNSSSTDGVPAEHSSNGSSVGSGLAGDEFSSASSIDDQLLDNDTSSSGYTQEEQEELARLIFNDDDMNEYLLQEILNSVSPYGRIQQQIERTRSNEKQKKMNLTTMSDNDEWISRIIHEQAMSEMEQKIADDQEAMIISSIDTLREEATNSASASVGKKSSSSSSGKSKSSKSSSRRRKEASLAAHLTQTPPPNSNSCQLPKKSIAADLLLPRSIADLSAKIQSVSFTAGTFGSITSNNPQDSHHSLSSSSSSSSSSNCSTTTLTAAKTTTATGQTRLSINLTRKPGFKPTEHGGQKIAEALFNELTSLGNGESATRETLNSGRKKDNQQFKKTKQQRPTTTSSTINETLLGSTASPSFFGPANKSETNSASSSSSTAYNNLDHLLRHAASNADVSEAALHSILSSFHSPTCLDPSSSKHSLSSKTTEALQALIAQQQSHHHHHQQQHKKTLLANHKRCEFCSCEFPEGRTSSVSPCLHSPTTTNGSIAGCVTCMALPGSTTTTTSVLGTAISGAFNPRGIELKERLKLKLTKRTVQSLTEVKGPVTKSQQEKKKTAATASKATEKKPVVAEKSAKTKDFSINDKNNIDDLVRFIDGDDSSSTSNHHEQQISTAVAAAATTTANTAGTTSHESTSKKSRKKKERQAKATVQPAVTSPVSEEKSNTSPAIASSERTSPSPAPSAKPSPTPVSQAQQPLSKRKQKAKLKQEQQEQQQKKETSNAVSESLIPSKPTVSSTPVPPPPSSQGTTIHRGSVDRPCEPLDSPEEEVNWITISRKQSKHKPSTPSVPSLLATPVLPVVPPPSSKQQRPTTVAPPVTSTTKKSANSVQPKVIPSITNLTSNTPGPVISKAQTNNTSLGGHRQIPTTLPVQKLDTTPSTNLWKTNAVHEQTPVMSPGAASLVLTSSSLLATTPSYVPSHPVISSSSSLLSPMPTGSTSSSSDDYPATIGWDTNAHQTSLLSSVAPGPVQRRQPPFSPAPGALNHTTSRCIQRPSPEPRSSSSANAAAPFPLYFPMAYARPTNSTSAWNETPVTSVAHESQWNYPQEAKQQFGLASGSTNFPLYDPFHSGAGLPMPPSSSNQPSLLTNGFAEHFTDLYGVPHDNDVNDMDALDKEIEDYKRFCFENVPLETREKMQVNPDRCFVRQA